MDKKTIETLVKCKNEDETGQLSMKKESLDSFCSSYLNSVIDFIVV